MIYDYILSTGDTTISGCHSADLGTDRLNLINKNTAKSTSTFYFDSSLVGGDSFLQNALNGQTLFEETPIQTNTPSETIFQITTGDFFLKTGVANPAEKAKIFFAEVPAKPDSSVTYNILTGSSFVGTGQLDGSGIGNSLGSGISGVFPNASMDEFDFFLNGVKVYSGAGVSGYMEGDMTTFVPNFSTGAGGVVYSGNQDNCKATAYIKRDRINEITGVVADIYGSGFIEGQTRFYLNGVENYFPSYLELYTGVNLIVTGVDAAINSLGRNAVVEYLKL